MSCHCSSEEELWVAVLLSLEVDNFVCFAIVTARIGAVDQLRVAVEWLE